MAFIPTVNCLRSAVEGLYSGQQWVNTLWFGLADSPSVVDIAAVNTALADWWDVSMQPITNAACSLTKITTTDQSSSTAPSGVLTLTPALAGTASGSSIATNVACVIGFKTIGRGRSARGRNYVTGQDVNALSGATAFTSTYTNALAAAYVAMHDALATLGYQHVVVSFQLDLVPRSAGFKQLVTGYSVDPLIDSQRRRLAGRGI